MDLNRLLHQEQIAIMRRDAAIEPGLRAQYESEIHRLGQALGAHAYPHRPFPDRRLRTRGVIKAFANQAHSDKFRT